MITVHVKLDAKARIANQDVVICPYGRDVVIAIRPCCKSINLKSTPSVSNTDAVVHVESWRNGGGCAFDIDTISPVPADDAISQIQSPLRRLIDTVQPAAGDVQAHQPNGKPLGDADRVAASRTINRCRIRAVIPDNADTLVDGQVLHIRARIDNDVTGLGVVDRQLNGVVGALVDPLPPGPYR